MKFAIIGGGSIGKRHLGNLIATGVSPSDILVVEPKADRIEECRAKFGISESYESIEQLPSTSIDAALVCSPTSFHIKQSLTMASRGAHLLIEKPLAHNLGDVDELKKLVARKNIKVLIAYPFRFSEHALKFKEIITSQVAGQPLYIHGEFSEYLPDWHPWEDYRSFYMAKKSLGGGSLLDQSHIIDIAHWCFGPAKDVFGYNSQVSELEVETDDIAEIQVRFITGLIGTIHQDMFGRKHSKYMEAKCTQGNVRWDVYDLSANVFTAKDKKTKTYSFKGDHQIMYLNEISHFIDLCRGKTKEPLCTLEEGIHSMKIIDAVLRSQVSGRLEEVN